MPMYWVMLSSESISAASSSIVRSVPGLHDQRRQQQVRHRADKPRLRQPAREVAAIDLLNIGQSRRQPARVKTIAARQHPACAVVCERGDHAMALATFVAVVRASQQFDTGADEPHLQIMLEREQRQRSIDTGLPQPAPPTIYARFADRSLLALFVGFALLASVTEIRTRRRMKAL